MCKHEDCRTEMQILLDQDIVRVIAVCNSCEHEFEDTAQVFKCVSETEDPVGGIDTCEHLKCHRSIDKVGDEVTVLDNCEDCGYSQTRKFVKEGK